MGQINTCVSVCIWSQLQKRAVIYISASLWHPPSCLFFQSDSSVTITCTNGKWNKQVSCEPVDCGLPDKYHVHPAHFDFPEGTTYGKKSTFRCREPAQLVGEIHSRVCTHTSTDTFNKTVVYTLMRVWCTLWNRLVSVCQVGFVKKLQPNFNAEAHNMAKRGSH